MERAVWLAVVDLLAKLESVAMASLRRHHVVLGVHQVLPLVGLVHSATVRNAKVSVLGVAVVQVQHQILRFSIKFKHLNEGEGKNDKVTS